jgi:hypothetical protein
MNLIQFRENFSVHSSVIYEIKSRYISYQSLLLLIEADENNERLEWLELKGIQAKNSPCIIDYVLNAFIFLFCSWNLLNSFHGNYLIDLPNKNRCK